MKAFNKSPFSNSSFNNTLSRASLGFFLIVALLLSACSDSSGDSDVLGDGSDMPTSTVNGSDGNIDTNSGNTTDTPATDITGTPEQGAESVPIDDEPTEAGDAANADNEEAATFTLVTFDITVPAYVSQALQVRVDWGADKTVASWVIDESWTAQGNLQTDSSFAVTVTFSDDNGDIVLGRANTTLTTTTHSAQTLEILVSQFDTASVDDDGDGVSNLDELIAGTNPLQAEAADATGAPPPVDASIELIADKTFRIHWQPSSAADYYRILENVDGSSGYEAISGELGATTDHFDHRVALYRRVNARYMVEACNSSGCTYSVQQLIEALDGHLEAGVGYFKSDIPHQSEQFICGESSRS